MENCCATRPNFGHPTCIEDLGVVTSFFFAPIRYSDGNLFGFSLASFTATTFNNSINNSDVNERLYPIAQLNNVELPQADSLFAESASGKKSFLRTGVRSLTAQTWDKDATSTFCAKLEEVRCNEWGIFLVTNTNKIIGSELNGTLYPIKIDSQSVDPKFMFKTDSETQMVSIAFDWDRNFRISSLYAISGDEIWDSVSSTVVTIDFNDVNKIIDCDLTLDGSVIATGWNVVVNDDYRQGARNVNNTDLGNVTGLLAGDFLITNVTDATTIIPTSVTEQANGNYAFIVPSQTSADKIKVSLVIGSNVINYNGSIEFLIP